MPESEKQKQKILDAFKDVNQMYNNCNKHDDLSSMLDELIEKAHEEGFESGQRNVLEAQNW